MLSSKNSYDTVNIPVKKIVIPKPTSHITENVVPITEHGTNSLVSEAQEKSAMIIAEAMDEANKQREKAIADLQVELDLLKQKAIEEVEELKQRAVDEAEALKNKTAIEVEELKQKAYDDAFREGHRQGYENGEAEANRRFTEQARKQLEDLKETCLQAQHEAENYIDGMIPELVELMKSIAEKVTLQSMENSETKLLPLIKNQLKELSRRKQIFIRVHPGSYDDIRQYEKMLQSFCVEAKIHFIQDETLSEFGCVIETESEIIDLQLDKQLAQLFTEFERVVTDQ